MMKWFLNEEVEEIDENDENENTLNYKKIIIEGESSNEESDEDEDYCDDEDFLSCKIYEDDNVKYYSTDVRDFIPNIKLWSTQRSVNQDHVQELVKNLKKHKDPQFIGTFKVIRDKECNKRLIDG